MSGTDDFKRQIYINEINKPSSDIVGGGKGIGSLVVLNRHEVAALPNKEQYMTMLYDYFTPHQAACFIAGLHPNFHGHHDGLGMARSIIIGGIKNNKLLLDDDQQIKADNLKRFLYEKGWLMKGFNDDGSYGNRNLAEMKEKLIEANDKILELTAKIDDLEIDNIILNSNGTIERITQLTKENKELKGKLKHADMLIEGHAELAQFILPSQIADLESQLELASAELETLKKSTLSEKKQLYITPAIEIMNKVILEFWLEYDPKQPAPKQDVIVNWIVDNFNVSTALALNIDKVCRHSDAKSGGKYKRQ